LASVGVAVTVQTVLSGIDLILTHWKMEVLLETVDIQMDGMFEFETGPADFQEPVELAGSEAGLVGRVVSLVQEKALVVVPVLAAVDAGGVVRISAAVAADELAAAVDTIQTVAVVAAVGAVAAVAAAVTEAVVDVVVVAASALSAAVAEAVAVAVAAQASGATAAAAPAKGDAVETVVPESVDVSALEAELQFVAS
jgi:hypothetical protein